MTMAVDAQNLKSHHAGMDSLLNFGMDCSSDMSESQAMMRAAAAAAAGGGGGRRKQSKPIRVFMDMAPADTEVRPAEAMDAGDIPELTQPKSPGSRDMAMDIDDLINCDLCNDTFLTQSALTEHIQAVHDLGSDRSGPSIFPTKYHQAGIQLQQEIGLPSSSGGSPDLPTTPKQSNEDRNMPLIGRSSQSPDNDSNSHGASSPGAITGENRNRIFHKDAFCKLCDREFCNKYFLKTHMANKHGVYDSGSPSESPKLPTMNGNGNGPSFAETLASLPQLNSNGNGQSAFGPPPPSSQTSSHADMLLPAPKASVQSSMPLPPSLPASQPPSMSLQPPEMSPAKTSPPRSLPQTPSKPNPGPTSKDMEDYCEICQKHFCNKYYLKKHKQDVHGIIPEPSPQSGKRGRPTSMNSSKSSSPLSDCISSTGQLPLLPPGLDVLAGNAGMPPGLGNVMFINPFAPPFALLQSQPSVLPGFPPGLPPPPPVSAGSESPNSTARPPSNSTSPGSLPPPSGDRQMPVNPEAYCDLCRKEFCNKHFLKIHKANKHGVFYEDLPSIIQQASMSQLPVLNVPSIPNPGSGQSDNPSGVIHITPTGMDGIKIKSENPDSAKLDDPLKPRDLSIPSSPVKGEMCTVCKKEFNNKYSLQIHMINAHNMKPADLDMALGMSEPKSEHMLQGTMFSNMIAAKLADRVMCDICNKEVCNKYFLKTHKLKVHGIDTSKEEKNEREKASPPRTKPSTTSVIQAPKMSALPIQPMKEMPGAQKILTPSTQEPSTHTPRPNDEELLKMGIDPEAYCEICKKEFCSKYFLKTHRANIHGIKSNGTSSTPEKSDRPLKPMGPTGPPPLLPFPLPDGKDFPGLPGLPQSLAQSISQSLGQLGQQHPLSLPSLTQPPPMPSQAPPPPLLGFGDSWSWKDPANAQRVRCEICNKDLCNRYFLKTHMLNKHGLNYDPATGTTLPSGQPGSQMQPENLSLRQEDKKVEDMKPGDEDSCDSRSTISAKTWHVPPTGMEKMDVMPTNNKENMPGGEKKELIKTSEGNYFIQKCQLCGMIFGEKVTLQLHMIRDHQGKVTVSTEPPSTTGSQLAFNLKKKYQRRKLKSMRFRRFGPSVGGAIGEKVRSAIVNHIANHQKNKKKFRCAHCQERFLSKPQCQAHIRQAHPNVKPSSASGADDCSRSPAPAKVAPASVPLANNNQGEMTAARHNVIMQAFNLEENNPQLFASSVVHLPVFHKISEPVSVTFTLTPTTDN